MKVINAYPTLARVPMAVLVDDPPVDDAGEAPVAGVPPVGSGTVIVVVGPPPLGVDVLRIGAVILRLIEDTLVPLQRVL